MRAYKFYYNSYGELARVELPTGGAVEYDMTPGSGVVCAYGPCSQPDDGPQIYRRVVERRVYPNGSTGASFARKEVYSNSETVGGTTATVTVEQSSQSGVVPARSRHTFDGSALDSLFGGSSADAYGAWYEGREKQTEALDTVGAIGTATVLRRVVNTWAQRTSVSWWASWASTHGLPLAQEPTKDPRLIETVTTVEPSGANLVTKTTSVNPQTGAVGFDQYNNPTDSWEYDYGTTPGTGARPETTDRPAPTPQGGVFIDTHALRAGEPESKLQQAVFVGQFPRSGGGATTVFRTATNEITKNADKGVVSISIGKTKKVR